MDIDKDKLRDNQGRPLTQGLFLEFDYNTKFAVYTLKDEDYEYEGKVYPSLKRLYLEMEDPVEYEFANTYLSCWAAWKRICANKFFSKRIAEWREELELRLRARGVKEMMKKSTDSPMAAKWLADRGWVEKQAGRPSKADIEAERRAIAEAQTDWDADIHRLGS